MPDAIFEDPRLARVYDPLDPDRGDLDAYVAFIDEVEATSVLDLGCGTGTLACLFAGRGLTVVAVDPAAASLEVARRKPLADQVQWILGDAKTLPALSVDAAVMTGNVAQVFVTDDEWMATLRGVRGALRPRGWLMFEARVPSRKAWEQWTPELTRSTVDVHDVGPVESWHELLEVNGDLVSFRTMTRFHRDDLLIESRSTLRFRTRSQIEVSLAAADYEIVDVRDAPDRPGHEHVFVATRHL